MSKLTYFGHSAFMIEHNNYKILIDPFITGNPFAPVRAEDLTANFIVLSHAHGDHYGDTENIAKRSSATVIAVNELANYAASKGLKAHNMHIGGSYEFPFGKVKFTIAHHGSSSNEGEYMGEPAGILIFLNDKVIYHAGDTGLFSDMKLIGELHKINIALLPIGDNFTMGINDALKAVELLNPDLTIPMHYNTFPVIKADPDKFVEMVLKSGRKALKLNFGETLEI